jgi:CMP-2-keto-3-deoxyoctulosonic acid synthetase
MIVNVQGDHPSAATDEKIEEIAEVFSVNTINSVRSISGELNISKSVVHRTMREVLGFKPYKMHLHSSYTTRTKIYGSKWLKYYY